MTKINVLDNGYVRLVDVMGSELSIVNAARVSYDKESTEFDEKDVKLLDFLIREKHLSPFRHVAMTFEVYSPLMVARQHWKYAVGSAHLDDQNAWNESSRRYITENEVFYIPNDEAWRSKPANSKQGSGEPISDEYGKQLSKLLQDHITKSESLYDYAMQIGAAPELARLFLPAYSMYIRYRWTCSLASVIHFLNERLKEDAQFEIREYAKAVYDLVQPHFPNCIDKLVDSDSQPKNYTIKKMNNDISDIVDKAKALHENALGHWEVIYNPDPINFNMGAKNE